MSIIIAVLSFIAVLPAAERTAPTEGVKVEDQIAELEKMIIPPEGTEKANVDIIFGEPKEIKVTLAKVLSVKYPDLVYIYELLPPIGKQEFRAYLYIKCRNGKVWMPGINHLCVIKGRPIFMKGSPEEIRKKQEIELEKHEVLIDLNEIRDKFTEKLKSASWNKKESEPKDTSNSSSPDR